MPKDMRSFLNHAGDMVLEGDKPVTREDLSTLIIQANRLTFVLGERWPNCKLAIAVDDDVDITSAEDLVWSISTRVDAAEHMFAIPNSRGHPINPTAKQIGDNPRDVLFTKWGLDATKPPLQDADARVRFERTLPPNHGTVRLEDFL